jgi:hypothetical protein
LEADLFLFAVFLFAVLTVVMALNSGPPVRQAIMSIALRKARKGRICDVRQ